MNTRPPATAGTLAGTTPEAGRAGQSTTDTTTASWPVTTWQGWQHFATTAPPAPPQPGEAPRSLEERLAYHSAFVTVRTPAINTLATSVRTLMILGRHQTTTARPSLIVTGPAAAGKTTALLHVGRTCHLAHLHRTPTPPGHHPQVPVAYVLVPPGATAKTLTAEFARYLGIPTTTRMTQAQITEAVCHTYNTAGVQLVLIDEIHRLNPRTTTGAQAADLLKDLTERIRATFVYAGLDVTATPLFSGVRGAQLAGRATLIDCGPSPPATAEPAPSPTSSPTSKTPSTSTTTAPAPSPATRPTSTSAPPAASDPSPASSAKPPSPPSPTAPNASPRKHSKPSSSTTSPNNTTAPTPAPAGRPHRHDADGTTTSDIPADDASAAARGRVWDVLIPARAGYLAGISPHYDEVFHDVAQRTQHASSLGKTDIAALPVWKRLSAQTRWVSALMSLPDTQVRAVTERAVIAVHDTALTRGQAARTGRSIMAELPGFRTGDALASAILTAAAPTRMAVYDRRIQHALPDAAPRRTHVA
ncbi:TniB family NTP-binding protein [Streptomyces canus]|uniref:TniB family NTP-binding protein n=1 Tax=Streptomyces canus TaxID=58343 RepID=UPI003868B274